MTLDELQKNCDWFLSHEVFVGLGRYWLTHFEMAKRQQVNAGIVIVLKECGFDELMAAAYQRGLTAGLDIAAHLYRGPIDS